MNTVEPLAPLYERPKSAMVDAGLPAARARFGSQSAPDWLATAAVGPLGGRQPKQ